MHRFKRFLPILIALPTYLYCKSQEGYNLYVWGSSRNGQLGLGIESNTSIPTLLPNMKFIDVSARRSCSAAVTSDGKLFTWGNGRNGILGQDSSNVNILVPKEVPVNDTFKQVSCGYQHMCAVTTNGEVYVWGNVDDSAGKFRVIGTKEQDRKNSNRKARKVEKLSGIKEVACSAQHTVALASNGSLYSWGNSKRIGRGGNEHDPGQIGLNNIIKVVCGMDFTVALDNKGRVYSWGSNNFGQLGIPSIKYINIPQQIEYLSKEEIIDISCGDNFAGAITKSGRVYTWGFGNEGQLGHGDKLDQNTPRVMKFDATPIQISCGGAHTAILTQANEIFMFGRGRQGQIGHQQKDESNTAYKLKPRLVESLRNILVYKVVCGGNHTMVLTT